MKNENQNASFQKENTQSNRPSSNTRTGEAAGMGGVSNKNKVNGQADYEGINSQGINQGDNTFSQKK